MKLIFSLASLLFSAMLFAQNDRQNDFNNISWVQTFVTKKIGPKTDFLIEYQWRRTNGLKNWQQGLFRTAIQLKISEVVTVAAGYAEVETFKYGNYPVANNGTFPEHRIYEQIIFKQPIKKWVFTHRFRIEQRWLGRVKTGTDREIEEWSFLHRFRYQFKTQYSITAKFYAAVADEIFIGAGKNVGVNIFDQNRIFYWQGLSLIKISSLKPVILTKPCSRDEG